MENNTTGADLSSFIYVDARYGNSGWKRLAVTDIPAFVEKHRNHDVYCTIQRYSLKTDSSRKNGKDEPMIAPLFFDIDSKRNILQLIDQGWILLSDIKQLVTPAVYDQLERREHGQPVEDALMIELAIKPYQIDNPEDKEKRVEHYRELPQALADFIWHSNIEIARDDVRKLVDFFMKFNITEDEIRVWFSGKKGFHVTVHETVAGITPHTKLHQVVKHIAIFLEETLELRSLDKASIYAKGRLWRIPGTVHAGTNRYKTELKHEELGNDPLWIINHAKTPRAPLYKEEEFEYFVNPALNDWYMGHFQNWEEADKALSSKVGTSRVEALVTMEGYPACIKYMLEHGAELLRHTGGNRNAITYRLGAYFKDAGFTFEQAYDRILDWAMSLPNEVSASSATEKRANTRSSLKSVYDSETYHFSCGATRGIGKKSAHDKTIIPCSGRACAVHEDHGIDEINATKLHLADTAKAEHVEKKVAFDCLVAGKLDTPYQVPKKVQFICRAMDMEKALCQGCIMGENNGSYEKEFHENDRFLIEAANQPDNNLKGILRSHSNAACNKVGYDVLEYSNITEVLVVPMAERVSSIRVGEDDKAVKMETALDESGHEYVYRKVYVVGPSIKSNEYYEFSGYVYPHPKNQLATVLSQEQKPKQDTVGSFKVTDALREEFKVMQVQEGETISDRLDKIMNDLSSNVTLVRQRDAAHLAVLLSYHSVLRYYFTPDELEARGWVEVCLIGDSGQAKTLLVQRLQEFIGLGELIGGELAGRTGLLYNLQQIGDRWFITFGKYPLNDRKLLAIDEFSGLSEGDFEQMTEARETGVLKVNRVVQTETNARTRLIFMSNPRHGKQLAEYTYGVESLKSLFREAADIRRLDLAVFLKSGDVPKSVLNAKYTKPTYQMIRSDVMKASVLWAWSRSEDQIDITEKAMDRILYHATELGEKYGSATDIPLLEPATLRKKLARMGIALAALLHSSDETHERIVVLPEHVDYIAKDFIDVLYSYKNCRLDTYAGKMRNESVLTSDETDTLLQELSSDDFAENTYATREVLDIFRKNDVLRPQDIIDMTGLEKATVQTRLSLLQKHSMIRRAKDGMRKLPKFIEFLEIYFGEDV